MNTEINEDQQKLIDLIRTQKYNNIRIALTLDITENLQVNSIYSEIYKKYNYKDLSDNERELVLCFPIICSLSFFKNTYTDGFELSDFGNDIDIFLDYLLDLKKYFCSSFPPLRLELMYDHPLILSNDLLGMHEYQKKIADITGLQLSQITIYTS